MNATTYAVDLASQVFQVHGYDQRGQKVYARRHQRKAFIRWCQQLPAGVCVRMEATGAAHHWGRLLEARSVRVELLPPQHVKALLIGNKTDANDADAIYEAGLRPKVRPVAVKTPLQQALQACHRLREGRVRDRTRLLNQVRGMLAEFGLVLPRGVAQVRLQLPGILEDAGNALPDLMRELLAGCLADLERLDARIAGLDQCLERAAAASPDCQRMLGVEGIGTLTATAALGPLADRRITRARAFAASLGLTPREHSSGSQRRLGHITKRGNGYLRKLLIHGARSALYAARRKHDPRSRWMTTLEQRLGPNKAAVALANKNARILWALVHHQQDYRRPKAA
jgi:transposase